MIIYLYGPDSYGRQQKLNWYAGKFKEKHSALTIEHFDLALPEDLPRLKTFATAQSLFDNFKFGVLDNAAESDPKDLQAIFKVASQSNSLTLALSSTKALSKDFKVPDEKPNIVLEFPEPDPRSFLILIKKEAAARGLKLSAATLDALYKSHKGDSWGLINELEKMALGASPEPYLGEQNFFALTGALQKSGPPGYRLAALERLLLESEPAMIFNFIASRAGVELKTKMADYDVAIKSGKLEYEEALTSLAISD